MGPVVDVSCSPKLQTLGPVIPFNSPSLTPLARTFLAEASSAPHHSGDGPFTKRCKELLERALTAPTALLTTSCTHALEMSALLLKLQPGDEVIVPSFSFVTTANAFVLHGARAVFCDVRKDTCNLDAAHLETLVTPRTRAVVPVHYAGVGCDMQRILEIARQHRFVVVEDNAHGLFGSIAGKPLGTFGALSTNSFHETKNFSCGEGGALIVNDPSLVERALVLREKGTDRSRFFRGMVDKYTWQDVGSSYLPSDLLAAILLGQLESRATIQSTRERIWLAYHTELASWADANGVRQPHVPAGCAQTYHLYYLVLPSLAARTGFLAHMKERGIIATFHYQALHLSPMGERFGGAVGDCPVSESLGDTLVRLPIYNTMTDVETSAVIDAVKAFRSSR